MQTLPANTAVIFNNVVNGDGYQTADLIFVNGGYYDANGYVKTIPVKGSEPEPEPTPDPTPVDWQLIYHGIKPGAANYADWTCNDTYNGVEGSTQQVAVWNAWYNEEGTALDFMAADNSVYNTSYYPVAYAKMGGTMWHELDLTNYTNAKVNFEHTADHSASLKCSLRVKCDSIDDKIAIPNWPEKWSETNWTSSGDIDLSAYAGKKISLGFYYSSDETVQDTWAVRNVKVYTNTPAEEPTPEPEPDPTPVEWRLMYHGIKQSSTEYADYSDWSCNDTYNGVEGSTQQVPVWRKSYDQAGAYVHGMLANNGIYGDWDSYYSYPGAYTKVEGTLWHEFDFTDCTNVKINFEHESEEPTSLERCLRVKCDSIDDKIAIPQWNGWGGTSSGDIDLSAYAGKKISLGFYCSGEADKETWWQIRDVKVYVNAEGGQPVPDPTPTPTPAGKTLIYHGLNSASATTDWTSEENLFSDEDGTNWMVWRWKEYNGSYVANASSYIDGVNYPASANLVSPKISLKGKKNVTMSFEHAAKFQSTLRDYCNVYIYLEDQEFYHPLEFIWPEAGKWNFTNSGDIDLTDFVKYDNVRIVCEYTGSPDGADTWELRNFKIYADEDSVDPTPEPDPTPTYPEFYINYGSAATMVPMTHQGENVYTVEIPRLDKTFYISNKDSSIKYGSASMYNLEPSDSVYQLINKVYNNYLKVPTAILNAKLTFNLTDATLRVEGTLDMPELFINYGSEETRVPMTYVSKRVYTVTLPRLENKFVISSADPTKICYGGTLNIAPSETTYRLVSTSSTWNTNPKYLTVPTPILNAQLTFDFSNASLLVSGELVQPDPDDRIITVTVENPGELQEKFLATEGAGIHTTVWLEVHGPVNDTDLLWCSKIKHLKTLNLWNAETTSVPANFMKGSTTLEVVALPQGATTIGSYALSSCPKLWSVSMGREMQSIGSYVLAYSTALNALYSSADVAPSASSTFMYNVTKSNVAVYMPMVDPRSYFNASVWKECQLYLLNAPVDSATIDLSVNLLPDTANLVLERKPDINLIARRAQSSSQINCGNLTILNPTEELDSLPVYGLGKVKLSQIRDCRDGNMQSEYCPTLRVWRENMTAEAATTEINFRKNTWHFLSFPYDVKMSEIVNPNASDFVIRRYDSAKRASGEAGSRWSDVGADETLKAGEGYILQTANNIWDANTGTYKTALLEFPATAETATRIMDVEREVALTEYPSEKLNDRSWNLVGNPFPCYYDLRKSESLLAPIVIWRGNSYQAYSMEDDHVILRPNEAFFLQKPEDLDKIEFSSYGTYTLGNANYVVDNDGAAPGHRIIALDRNVEEMVENPEMGAKTTAAHRHVFNFHVEGCGADDRARIVLNEEASPAYEAERDAEKFFADRCTGVEMYVSDGVKYDICERPMGDGLAALDLVAAQAGEYTFSLKGSNMDGYTATLIDTATGAQIDLTGESYKATLPKGTTAGRFQIRFRADDTTFVRSLMAPDTEVTVCTLNGVTIYTGRISDFSAEEGLYIVKSADKAYKVIVK